MPIAVLLMFRILLARALRPEVEDIQAQATKAIESGHGLDDLQHGEQGAGHDQAIQCDEQRQKLRRGQWKHERGCDPRSGRFALWVVGISTRQIKRLAYEWEVNPFEWEEYTKQWKPRLDAFQVKGACQVDMVYVCSNSHLLEELRRYQRNTIQHLVLSGMGMDGTQLIWSTTERSYLAVDDAYTREIVLEVAKLMQPQGAVVLEADKTVSMDPEESLGHYFSRALGNQTEDKHLSLIAPAGHISPTTTSLYAYKPSGVAAVDFGGPALSMGCFRSKLKVEAGGWARARFSGKSRSRACLVESVDGHRREITAVYLDSRMQLWRKTIPFTQVVEAVPIEGFMLTLNLDGKDVSKKPAEVQLFKKGFARYYNEKVGWRIGWSVWPPKQPGEVFVDIKWLRPNEHLPESRAWAL